MNLNINSTELRIITVEDSPLMIKQMQCILRGISGLDFVGNAVNISTALALAEKHNPHVAILDISLEDDMPKRNGINLLIEFRKKYSDMIIIMFTALIEPQYKDTCELFGADYFFNKYNDFEELPKLLNELVRKENSK